uniref:Uncharacterized protein n=1 Tax=Anguilla anguilla TaxID=7936 RepID=A0A0E9VHL2_ANGAN
MEAIFIAVFQRHCQYDPEMFTCLTWACYAIFTL